MNRKAKPEPKKLVLRRSALRVLDDDALHQLKGGAAKSTSFNPMEQLGAN